jgi:hypothetical protein
MLHRFLTLTQIPEFRTEPGNPESGIIDIEVLIPVDVLWQAEEIIKELKFLKASGFSTSRLSAKFNNLLKTYVVNERDRIALIKGSSAA